MSQYSQKLTYILFLGLILTNPQPIKAAVNNIDPAYQASIMGVSSGEVCAKTLKTFVPAPQRDERYSTVRMVTAYSSTPDQTDDTPFITANGTRVHDGIIAANWLKFGTRVRIPEMFGDKVFIVTDRMHPRFDDRADIWMESREDALAFGARRLTIEVL